MTKTEHQHLTIVAAQLETIIGQLQETIAPIAHKERVGITCEQIIALRDIMADISGTSSISKNK